MIQIKQFSLLWSLIKYYELFTISIISSVFLPVTSIISLGKILCFSNSFMYFSSKNSLEGGNASKISIPNLVS